MENIINIFCKKQKECEFRTLFQEDWLQYFKIRGQSWQVECNSKDNKIKGEIGNYMIGIDKYKEYYKSVKYFNKLKKKAKELNGNIFQGHEYETDQILYYYLLCRENICSITILPEKTNTENLDKFIEKISKEIKIHFIKKFTLSTKQSLPFLYQLYSKLSYMKKYEELKKLSKEFGWSGDIKKEITVIFYEKIDTKLNIKIKNKIWFTNDYFSTIDVGSLILNESNFKYFDQCLFDRFLRINNKKAKLMFLAYKKYMCNHINYLDIPRFLIFSSFVLYINGLREPNDLDVIVYHKPRAKSQELIDMLKIGTTSKLLGFIELQVKGYGNWKKGGVCEYQDNWFLKEWPNLFGASDYEEMIFNPRYNMNFMGMKILCLYGDMQRRIQRKRPASYANLIAINKLLNMKNVQIPPIPESYWKNHKIYYYKTDEEKLTLYKTIKFYLNKRYNININVNEIKQLLSKKKIKN